MNKVIKFVLLVLFIVISISSANIVKNNFVDKQIEKKYKVCQLKLGHLLFLGVRMVE